MEDHHNGSEDLPTTDEEHDSGWENVRTSDDEQDHHTGENFYTTYNEEDHHTGENYYTTYDDEDVNMEVSENRFSAPMALIRNQLKAPGMTMTQWSAKTQEVLSVGNAKTRETLSRASATVNYHVYSITHPLHPERREAAKEVAKQKKLFAADRRTKREAEARSSAAAKIAAARQGRIETLQEGVH